MLNSKELSYFNYFYIALVLLWSPLQGTILSIDGKGRILFLLTIVVFIVNCNKRAFRKILTSKPVAIWLIWCIYAILNTYYHGYENEYTTLPNFAVNMVFCPFVIMAVSSYEYLRNSSKFIKIALWIFLIYTFLGAFVMDIGYFAAAAGVTDANTLGNALALNMIMIIFFAGVRYCRKEATLKTTVALIMFAIAIVVISATRKALGAGVIMIIALMLSRIKPTFNSFMKMILPTVLLYCGLIFVMNNTQMGERLLEIDEATEIMDERYDIGDNEFLKAMGDRAPQYILGTELFLENPVTGIGLNNFSRVSGYPFVLHTEYMVQLCECGIIGTILFVMFYVTIIKRLWKKYKIAKNVRELSIMMLGSIAALLFIYLTAWSYCFPFYFVVLGTIIGHIYSKSPINNNKQV